METTLSLEPGDYMFKNPLVVDGENDVDDFVEDETIFFLYDTSDYTTEAVSAMLRIYDSSSNVVAYQSLRLAPGAHVFYINVINGEANVGVFGDLVDDGSLKPGTYDWTISVSGKTLVEGSFGLKAKAAD